MFYLYWPVMRGEIDKIRYWRYVLQYEISTNIAHLTNTDCHYWIVLFCKTNVNIYFLSLWDMPAIVLLSQKFSKSIKMILMCYVVVILLCELDNVNKIYFIPYLYHYFINDTLSISEIVIPLVSRQVCFKH